MTIKEKASRVNDIIKELGISKCSSTYIGDDLYRGISGGEKKRTNIGVELIKNPSLLFLDEPTSGLDGFQALNVVEALKVLATNKKT